MMRAALAAAVLIVVADAVAVQAVPIAGSSSAPPAGYLPVGPDDVCPALFRRHYRPPVADSEGGPQVTEPGGRGPEPPDDVTVDLWPCHHFRFFALVDRTSHMEEDRLLVVPQTTPLIQACYIADLIRSVEALSRSRFVELKFQNVSISGPLRLVDIDVPARLSFVDVDFVRPASRGSSNAPSLPSDCRTPRAGSGPVDASVLFERANFGQPVVFDNVRFAGDFISRRSNFARRLDIVQGDVGGDLVLESSDFERSLVLGQDTIFRGQIVLDGVRVNGNLDLDDVELIDTYLGPEDTADLRQLDDMQLQNIFDQADACVCVQSNGSHHINWSKLNVQNPTTESKEQLEENCATFSNIPRCPRSNGFDPALIEFNDVDVKVTLSVSNLGLGAREADFRPFKSSDRRFKTLGARASDLREQIKTESSLSRLRSTDVVLYNVNVANNAVLRNNMTSVFYIERSDIHFVNSELNEFGRLPVIRNSFDIFKSLRDEIYRGIYVSRNTISRSLIIDSVTFDGSLLPANSSQAYFEITHNEIGQDFTVTPFAFKLGPVREWNLSTNRVRGEVSVSLPTVLDEQTGLYSLAWTGDVSLTNLRVDGTVNLALTQQQRKQDPTQRRAIALDGPAANGFLMCKPRADLSAPVHVRLGGTQATNVLWNVPLRKGGDDEAVCVTWQGTGFRYGGWEAGDGWGSSASDDGPVEVGEDGVSDPKVADFLAWRKIHPEPAPDPLHQMANYLWGLGKQAESRDVRSEAKAAAFPIPSGNWISTSTVGNMVARFILWPTDFGLRPERAVFLLFLVVIIASIIYALSVAQWRRIWAAAIDRRDSLREREKLGEAIRQHLVLKDIDRRTSYELREEMRPWREDPDVHNLLHKYMPILDENEGKETEEKSTRKTLRQIPENLIMHISLVPGFMQYDRDRQPQDFSLFRLAVDATIPVIDLHAYSQYFPLSRWLRGFMMTQHLFGWWLLTSFLASLAVL